MRVYTNNNTRNSREWTGVFPTRPDNPPRCVATRGGNPSGPLIGGRSPFPFDCDDAYKEIIDAYSGRRLHLPLSIVARYTVASQDPLLPEQAAICA